MKQQFSIMLVITVLLLMVLIPVFSLAETIVVIDDDFEATSVFTTRTTYFDPIFHTSEVKQQSSGNHVWRLSIGDGASTGDLSVACYTKDYNSYIFPSNAADITYEADIWIVNNNQMPGDVYYGMNFGYQDRIMRLRFSWDTKKIQYQWTTGTNTVVLPQTFASGTWHSVKIVYHTSSKTCDIYIDDIVQSMGYSTVISTDSNVSVGGYNPLIKFNLFTKTSALPLSLNNPIRVNFDNVKVSYTLEETPATGDNSSMVLLASTLLIVITGAFLITWIIKKMRIKNL